MKIGEDEWNMLPYMNEERRDCGVYISGNRIYLIGGRYNSSVEYYDVQRNKFFLVKNVEVPEGGAVCSLINDKIYVITPCELRVFSKGLKKVLSRYKIKRSSSYEIETSSSGEIEDSGSDEIEDSSSDEIEFSGPYCYSNVIVKGSRLIFINSQQQLVYSFDSLLQRIERIQGF
jgi:hypothetical protein